MVKNAHQRIYLIRHGETEWTLARKHTGMTDIPLTEEGYEQAEWLKERLADIKFKKVFVSPLQRAQETCKVAGLFEHAEALEDLSEWNYGDYEGLTTVQIREKVPDWTIFTKGALNGESVGDVGNRCNRVISKIRGTKGDVAIFSHGHFLRAFAAKWLGLPAQNGRHFVLSTASVSVLGYEKEVPAILTWNEPPKYSPL